MRLINSTIATCFFELSRILTLQRLAVSMVLALFPPIMLGLVLSISQIWSSATIPFPLFIANVFTYLVCILSILLWATPNVYSELEGKSWIFTACRPNGRIAMLLGKYLASLIFSFGVCAVSITLCTIIIQLMTGAFREPLDSWLAMMTIFFAACATYGAIFSMIGTLFYRRSMVIAAGYMIVSEAVLANIPAIISRISMRFHLQFLGLHWFGDFMPIGKDDVYSHYFLPGDTSTWYHLAAMGIAILTTLAFASYVITSREYVTSDQT